MQKQSTGALRDRFDRRDYRIADYLIAKKAPPRLDLSNKMLPVRNQDGEPACVAFAATAVKEWQERNRHLSPRFLYDRIAEPGGGAYPRNAMKVLMSTGVCPETCQPFIPGTKLPPCSKAIDLAVPNKIKGYARLSTIDEMKQCLLEKGPFLISFTVNDSWHSPEGGKVIWKEQITGAHAVAFVGYDDYTRQIKFKNSWGNWGDNGYGYISYDDAMKSLYDAWSVVDIPELEEEGNTAHQTLYETLVILLTGLLSSIIALFKKKK